MKYLSIFGGGVVLACALFFWGVSYGKKLKNAEYLEKSEQIQIDFNKENEKIKEKYPVGSPHFPLLGGLCEK